jgi:O-antigen/teichoic acid export membrane protein
MKFNAYSINKIEKGVLFNFILRISQIFIQLISIFLISKFFNSIEIGYYYVLNSYAGISIFFELGFSYVIMQNASHESANIPRDSFFMSNHDFGKLSSLFRFVLKWYSYSSIIFITIVYSFAFYFFNSEENLSVNWNIPLIILMLSIGLSSFMNGIYNFLEGCLFVMDVAKIRLIQNCAFIFLFVFFLVLDFKLSSYGLSLLISYLLSIFYLLKSNFFIFFKSLYNKNSRNIQIPLNWKKDIFPLQWRIAISTASGYFIYQIVNLISFKFQGPIITGKYGFTMSILNGIMIVTTVWASSRAPILSNLFAQKKINELKDLFKKTLLSVCITFIIFIIIFWIFKSIFIDKLHLIFFDRFLDNDSLFYLSIATLCNCLVSVFASYSRVNKEEPYLIPSVVGAILNLSIALIALKYFDFVQFSKILVLTNIFIGLPWSYLIYKNSNKKFNDIASK